MSETLQEAAPSLRDIGETEFRARYATDRFTSTVLRSRFNYIVDHVCARLLTNGFSPVIREFNDFSATLSAGNELQYATPAVAETLPAFYGSMRDAIANAVEELGVTNLSQGDLIVTNDPYRNGTHLNDVCFIRPVFVDGHLVTVLSVRAHMLDIGGVVPGGLSGMKTDVYQNGLSIPPTLLYRDDRPVRSAFRLILSNVRMGHLILPDLQTIFHSLRLGENLVRETLTRYGREAYEGAIRYACDASAEGARNALTAIPDGNYVGVDYIDSDGADAETSYRIQVEIVKRGTRMEISFDGTSHQARTSINGAWPDVKSSVAIALKFLLDPTAPYTSAWVRDIDIVVPSGTIVSAEPPDGAVMCYWEPMGSSIAAIWRALAATLGSGAVACDSRSFIHDAAGTDEAGAPFLLPITPRGGWGGSSAGDADSGQMGVYTNYLDPPVETSEASAPFYFLRKEYRIDSAGPGIHRGGAGQIVDTFWRTPVVHHLAMPAGVRSSSGTGVMDGVDGSRAGIWLLEQPPLEGRTLQLPDDGSVYAGSSPIAGVLNPETYELDAGGTYFHWGSQHDWPTRTSSIIRIISGGGGGWGDPYLRDPAAVLRDVRDGYVSVAGAAADYGVVVKGDPDTDPEGLVFEVSETHSLRSQRKPPLQPEGSLTPANVAEGRVAIREPVEGSCTECGNASLAEYPILAEDGWQQVIKCQDCLTSASRTRWKRLGYLQLPEDALAY